MHYYQFNIGDYQSHTSHLSEIEDLIYRRLLDWYYLHECPIPLDEAEVSRQIRMRSHIESIAIVLREYFECTDDGWIHHRANKEIAKADEKSEKASASAKARWSKKDANALPTQSESNATHNTLPITQDTLPKTQKKKSTSVACPDSVSQQVWDDWMTVRKEKKAKTLTETGWNQFVKQVEKAGWSIEQAISHCCLKQWVGFEAAWVAPKVNPADIVRLTVPSKNEPDPALEKIKADDKKAVPPSLEVLAKMAQLRKVNV
jgi:uncharacterized protein YdaU (DUF1376 family)